MFIAFAQPIQRASALTIALALIIGAMVPLVAPAAARAATADARINEFVANHVGTDTNEYVEVYGSAGTDLSSLTILHLEGDGTGAGVIDTVIPVGTTDAHGFWVSEFLNNKFENGTITLLLVEGFTGTTGSDLDVDNDGTLDVTPWTAGLDSVAVNDGGADDRAYSAAVLTAGYDGLPFAPGGASRIPDGADTDSPADWVRNDFDLEGIPGFSGEVEEGEAYNTPGAPNATTQATPTVHGVVISEVYGGGGNPGASYANDFVELRNVTDQPIQLDGASLQYASADGPGAFGANSGQVTELAGTIPAGGYYLIGEGAGTEGGPPLPTADLIDATPINLSAGSGKVVLVNGTSSLGCNGGSIPCGDAQLERIVDLVGYGRADFFEGDAAAPNGGNEASVQRRSSDGTLVDTDNNGADFVTGAPTPMNSTAGTEPSVSCGTATHRIHEVQGSGPASPVASQTVTIEGVVTGTFGGDDVEEIGYFVQEEDEQADDDPSTSEGVMVHDPERLAEVELLPDGAVIAVRGVVHEHFGKTRLTSVSGVAGCELTGAASAETVSLPVAHIDELERHEGMLVRFPQALTISEFFNFDRFGEIVLTTDRQFQPTAVEEPGSPAAAALAVANRLSRIMLDDATSTENADPARHPSGDAFTLMNRFRAGDTVANVTGVLDYAFGQYRVQPTQGADYTMHNERPATPADVGGSVTVASFNVLNYFTTIDDGTNDICGPDANQECRGADDLEELARQRAKIVAALAAMDADVVGLIEIENHPGDDPTADLVQGLNDATAPGTYDYVATGAIGTDAIRVALIYKPSTVSPVGDFALLDSTVDARFDDDRNRPVLAQAFEENAAGGIFTVAVNHLKSKGSGCGPDDDDPEQGNCNGTRTLAAQALVDWLATDPTGSGDLDALIVGDLNAYDKEDPIDAVRAGADDLQDTGDDWTDLVLQFEGEFAYSYLFDGQLGYLDHGLASPTMASQVAGATVWHINADEPDILDYDTSFKKDAQDAIYAPDPYRSSDHDPVIIGLDLGSFGFDALEPPIDETNVVRAGRIVPVKFSLNGDLGVDVLFTDIEVSECGAWPPGDGDPAASVGGGLRYDDEAEQYVFAWQTDAGWAGECKQLVLVLDDGSYLVATFDFQ